MPLRTTFGAQKALRCFASHFESQKRHLEALRVSLCCFFLKTVRVVLNMEFGDVSCRCTLRTSVDVESKLEA